MSSSSAPQPVPQVRFITSYRGNGSPSPERKWNALYPWDMINSQQAWSREEMCLYSVIGRSSTASLSTRPFVFGAAGWQGSTQPFWSTHNLLYTLFMGRWMVITEMQTLLKHYFSLSPLKSGSQELAGVSLGKIWVNIVHRCCQSWTH